MRSYVKKIIIFFKAKKVYKLPAKKKVLIYDRVGSELFLNYIDKNDVEILDVRGESINIILLIKSIFKKNLNYKFCYIDFVNPEVVLTFIDNNTDFYKIKEKNKNIITVFIQNGIRSIIGDVFYKIKQEISLNYKVDYMFCFGDAICSEYNKYIEGKTISIGSFKNNLFEKSNKESFNNEILFISQFRLSDKKSKLFIANPEKQILFEDFYKTETILLPILYNYCVRNRYKLTICGSSTEDSEQEKNYFNNIIGNSDWTFFSKNHSLDSYKLIENASILVTIDSTLGYEAFATGKKVAFFSSRGNYLNIEGVDFAWPLVIPKNGPFWTNFITNEELDRILNFLVNVNRNDWINLQKEFSKAIISYDFENKKFVELMKNLNIIKQY